MIPVEVKVVAAADEKPVENASVYLTFEEKRPLKDKQRSWHVKTNREGLARFPGVPPGKVLIQVVAQGWKTFGKHYELVQEADGARKFFEIKLQRPRRWY